MCIGLELGYGAALGIMVMNIILLLMIHEQVIINSAKEYMKHYGLHTAPFYVIVLTLRIESYYVYQCIGWVLRAI